MVPLASKLENREDLFAQWNDYLEQHQFSLGGNWEYDHGYFDRHLDDEHKVWLRIPFQVTHGRLDGEARDGEAVVKLGKPFVLRHIYNEGLDEEATPRVTGALIDQFQNTVENDAGVDPKWVEQARTLLDRVEQGIVQ